MKRNGQLKAITSFGLNDWERSIPQNASTFAPAYKVSKAGWAPLRTSDAALSEGQHETGEAFAMLRLNEQGFAHAVDELPDIYSIVEKALAQASSQTRGGRVSPTADVLAKWEIPFAINLKNEDWMRFSELAYQFIVRMAGIRIELCGTVDQKGLTVWFVPVSASPRGGTTLSLKDFMKRPEYLALYSDLKEYLNEELGYEVDVDADDVMFRDMGYTADERKHAIEERDAAAKAASDLGDALESEAKSFAVGFTKSFRKGLFR